MSDSRKYVLELRKDVPPEEMQSALESLAKKLSEPSPMLGGTNSDGKWLLWSDTLWNCGTLAVHEDDAR